MCCELLTLSECSNKHDNECKNPQAMTKKWLFYTPRKFY